MCLAWLSRHLQRSKAWQLRQAQPEQSNIAYCVPVGDTNDTTTARSLQNKIHLPAGTLDEHASTLNRPARARRRTERGTMPPTGRATRRPERALKSDNPTRKTDNLQTGHMQTVWAHHYVIGMSSPKVYCSLMNCCFNAYGDHM